MGTPMIQQSPLQKQPEGRKDDQGKAPLSLIDRTALMQLAQVLDMGKKKYSAHNWRGGIEFSRVIDAALRHLNAFNDGEDLDPESGLSHVAHAMCNCMFLLNFIQTHPEKDDRYKRPIHPQANSVSPYGGLGMGASTGLSDVFSGIAGLVGR